MKRLFHLTSPEAWRAFAENEAAATFAPASLATEGFVHLSFAEQLRGTLDTHFAETRELVLVELDAARLQDAVGEDLRFEPSRGGALFPHVYAPLPRASFRGWWRLLRNEHWEVPHLATLVADDVPPATQGVSFVAPRLG